MVVISIFNCFVFFQLSIPKDCKDSAFCIIMKKLIGPSAKFRIAGTVRTGYYKVAAGFYKIRIYKEYYFEKLELNCEVYQENLLHAPWM